jgi:hypothetical protein
MRKQLLKRMRCGLALMVVLVLLSVAPRSTLQPVAAQMSMNDGIVCTTSLDGTFTLTTKTGYVGTPDDNVIYMWGFSSGNMPFQHPSPVLCVNQGDTVTIILQNTLQEDVSIVFPGQDDVLANGAPAQPQFDGLGNLSSLTNVAPANGGSVTYRFVANHPGTFIYESGTNPAIQVRMGLFGALVVRPDMSAQNLVGAAQNAVDSSTELAAAGAFVGKEYVNGWLLTNNTDGSSCTISAVTNDTLICDGLAGGTDNLWQLDDSYTVSAMAEMFANNRLDSQFTIGAEYLVLFSEIDPYLNQAVESGQTYNLNNYKPRYWMINGRGFPDTIAPNFASWLPSQPYGALARIHPYDEMMNPLPALERFANVGTEVVPMHPHAKNALLINQDGRAVEGPLGEDMAWENFSVPVGPGQTYDGLFKWKNEEGYNPGTNPVPVTIPNTTDMVYGPMWSGSPYLGYQGPFPVGVASMNQCGEYYIISHNHALYQITSWGVPMTGPITFLRIDPPMPNSCP